MRGATAVAPVGAPKNGNMSELEDGREWTGLLSWASSGVTGDCGEVGLALAENLIEGDDGGDDNTIRITGSRTCNNSRFRAIL